MKKAEDIKQVVRKIAREQKLTLQKGATCIENPLHPENDPKTACTEWQQVKVPTEIVRMLQ